MIENAVIKTDGKAARIAKYREHLDKMSILLGDKYNLPEISGAIKQIAWAKDIRTKFAEALDRQREHLNPDTLLAVQNYIFCETSARWWIDRKDVSFEEHLIYAKTLGKVAENEVGKPVLSKSEVIVIDSSQSDKIVVSFVPSSAFPILQSRGFSPSVSGEWVNEISVSDNARCGVVDSLCLSLLQSGYAARVISPPAPPVLHDGKLLVVNGRLCVEAKTEAVYKAAARIGVRFVCVDGANRDDLRQFLDNYDVEVSESARGVVGYV